MSGRDPIEDLALDARDGPAKRLDDAAMDALVVGALDAVMPERRRPRWVVVAAAVVLVLVSGAASAAWVYRSWVGEWEESGTGTGTGAGTAALSGRGNGERGGRPTSRWTEPAGGVDGVSRTKSSSAWSEDTFIGTRCVASQPSNRTIAPRPLLVGDETDRAKNGRSPHPLTIASIIRVHELPGPSSTNSRTPSFQACRMTAG